MEKERARLSAMTEIPISHPELTPPPRGPRLGDLPRLLAALPRLGVAEAEVFAADLAAARGATGNAPGTPDRR
ncbi:MAG: hypothetical protein Q8N53_07075 [Longimicrobiales bacterium]|nr:hypothetical protein [Longimicrobiales bacterium]